MPGRHVVLIGMMGVGKTTVGTLLAHQLGYEFWDNDAALEEATGKTAAEVQQLQGPDGLHKTEASLLEAALSSPVPKVIAAPGSVALLPAPLPGAITVWLRSSVHREAANIARSGQHHRPLPADSEALLREVAADRAAAYTRLADIVIDVGSDPVLTTERVLEALRALPPGRRDRDPRSGA
ncbi:MAG TPA: shikimate kinase [Solirubrobacteraceae bacterium]|jgi:shikimate kinase